MKHFDLTSKTRIRSLDFLRGLVMVLMAIDHVRVYSGMPSWGATPGIFFTRWVTHFCVPTFVFFAGTAAFLYGNKINDRKELSRFLFIRGLLLIILEWTIIRFSWTFNLHACAGQRSMGAALALPGVYPRRNCLVPGLQEIYEI